MTSSYIQSNPPPMLAKCDTPLQLQGWPTEEAFSGFSRQPVQENPSSLYPWSQQSSHLPSSSGSQIWQNPAPHNSTLPMWSRAATHGAPPIPFGHLRPPDHGLVTRLTLGTFKHLLAILEPLEQVCLGWSRMLPLGSVQQGSNCGSMALDDIQ